ncbi:MAG: PIG-L family deacetylase, partial [Desulfosudaceae bacterium]
MSNILVIAVHPDDETLGCGGTLLRHREAGDATFWCLVTAMSEKSGFLPAQIAAREQEISKVAAEYDFQEVFQLGLAATRVDTYPMADTVTAISEVIDLVQPEIIYLPFHGDVHSDHRTIFQASYSCTKQFRYSSIRKIYLMETLSETEFAPA